MFDHHGIGSQLVAGGVFVLLGAAGLMRAQITLSHHTQLWGWVRFIPTWLDPWQATVGFAIVLGVGLYCLVDAFRKKRR